MCIAVLQTILIALLLIVTSWVTQVVKLKCYVLWCMTQESHEGCLKVLWRSSKGRFSSDKVNRCLQGQSISFKNHLLLVAPFLQLYGLGPNCKSSNVTKRSAESQQRTFSPDCLQIESDTTSHWALCSKDQSEDHSASLSCSLLTLWPFHISQQQWCDTGVTLVSIV
jgi:hypothetical protein